MRITAKIADEKIAEINNLLKNILPKRYRTSRSFKISPRNDYHGLDMYDDAGCISTLKTGTPAECVQAANNYLCEIAVEKCLELMKEKE